MTSEGTEQSCSSVLAVVVVVSDVGDVGNDERWGGGGGGACWTVVALIGRKQQKRFAKRRDVFRLWVTTTSHRNTEQQHSTLSNHVPTSVGCQSKNKTWNTKISTTLTAMLNYTHKWGSVLLAVKDGCLNLLLIHLDCLAARAVLLTFAMAALKLATPDLSLWCSETWSARCLLVEPEWLWTDGPANSSLQDAKTR